MSWIRCMCLKVVVPLINRGGRTLTGNDPPLSDVFFGLYDLKKFDRYGN